MLLHDFFTKKIKLTEATAKEKAAWVAQVTPAVEYAARQLGIDPRFIMDQWALETGYKIPANNNLGGLTNRGEGTGFREYSNIQDYAKDWVKQIESGWPTLKNVTTKIGIQSQPRIGIGFFKDYIIYIDNWHWFSV